MLTKASVFLSQAASNPETQRALVDLAKHVFTHPDTLQVVVELAQQLVPRVLQSQDTLDQVGEGRGHSTACLPACPACGADGWLAGRWGCRWRCCWAR